MIAIQQEIAFAAVGLLALALSLPARADDGPAIDLGVRYSF